jgi:hypothetical protein
MTCSSPMRIRSRSPMRSRGRGRNIIIILELFQYYTSDLIGCIILIFQVRK